MRRGYLTTPRRITSSCSTPPWPACPSCPTANRWWCADDAGYAAKAFLAHVAGAGCRFSVSFELSEPVKTAIRTLQRHTSVWEPAVTQGGELRDRAAVAEATGMADLSDYPAGSRLLIHREPLHPGAQQSIDDIAALDVRHRARARAEDRIRGLKDLGMANLPCDDYDRNAVWLQLSLIALNLLTWTQTLTLDGELAVAEPKRLRYQLLHVAARVVQSSRRTILRLARDWPWTDDLLAAFARLRALPPAPA